MDFSIWIKVLANAPIHLSLFAWRCFITRNGRNGFGWTKRLYIVFDDCFASRISFYL